MRAVIARITVPFILCGLITPAVAQSSATTVPHHLTHQWHKIANLPPGSPILIRTTAPSASIHCTLAWIDTNAVACDLPYDGAHNVFPISVVKSITPTGRRDHHMKTAGTIIAGVLGCALGGVLFDFDGESTTAGRLGCLGGAAVGATDVYFSSK